MAGVPAFQEEKIAKLATQPETFELFQNFPNPFNPVTTIRYGLPTESRVTVRVYNILGKEVATLVNDELKPAGYHAVVWDGRNQAGQMVSTGVYFVRMQAGGVVKTKKMLLIE